MAVLVLALVPIIVLVALWTWNSSQLYGDWRQQQNRSDASNEASRPVAQLISQLQEERVLSAAALAAPREYRKQLSTQRARTDAAVKAVNAVPDGGWNAPDDVRRDVEGLVDGLRKLDGYREGVDGKSASQKQTFDHYTDLVSLNLAVFNTLSKVGLSNIDQQASKVIDVNSAMEMLSRENAYFTRASVTGHLDPTDRARIASWTGATEFINNDKLLPSLSKDDARTYRNLLNSSAWKQKVSVEQGILGSPAGDTSEGPSSGTYTDAFPKDLATRWADSSKKVDTEIRQVNRSVVERLLVVTADELQDMKSRLIVTTALNAVAVLLVILITMATTRMLRRRISDLRSAALDLQTRLPDVVERMRMGETIDVDAELPAIDHSGDELGQLGQALNLARHTALETTVAQVGQFRGFERLLQRIARRTQLLIGQQMKKLTELERKHEDPEVLEGLFDLDHLTARLRRYEENLVILGGGQPQRRWRKPVLLLDVLRSAQSEVQDYRRIHIEVESRVWLSERAVGPVVHALAELMENAVGFSRPPTPVEVYAARVGRGLAVEIEDRGVGMDAEQYDEINRMMAEPPRMDVMSRADDVRLGLYVVSRLAQKLGIQVELRPSAFGGTRAVVLIPDDLVVDVPGQTDTGTEGAVVSWPPSDQGAQAGSDMAPGPVPPVRRPVPVGGPAEDAWTELPYRRGMANPIDGRHSDPTSEAVNAHRVPPEPGVVIRLDNPRQGPVGAPPRSAPAGAVKPLPRRVPQASLVDELRSPEAAGREHPDERAPVPQPAPSRSGATVGAFQRQSRLARRTTLETDHDNGSGGVVPPGTSFLTED